MGNPGQADYSTANAFMDAYTKYRNSLVASETAIGVKLTLHKLAVCGVRAECEWMKATETHMMMQIMGMTANAHEPPGLLALVPVASPLASAQVMVMQGQCRNA